MGTLIYIHPFYTAMLPCLSLLLLVAASAVLGQTDETGICTPLHGYVFYDPNTDPALSDPPRYGYEKRDGQYMGTWEDCGRACAEDSRCTHWSWNHLKSICFLMDERHTMMDESQWHTSAAHDCFISSGSVPAGCEGDEAWRGTGLCTPEHGFLYYDPNSDTDVSGLPRYGYDALSGDGMTTWEDCGRACSDDGRCTHWSWNHYGHICFLMDETHHVRKPSQWHISGHHDCFISAGSVPAGCE